MLKYYLCVSADTTSGEAAWGYRAYNSDGNVVISNGAVDRCSTGPKMALLAALDIMNTFKGTNVEIVTQNNYLIQLVEKSLVEWESNGWKKSNGKSPENLLLVKKLKESLEVTNSKAQFRQPNSDAERATLNFIKKGVVKNRSLQKVVN